jgi:hypothetical protein
MGGYTCYSLDVLAPRKAVENPKHQQWKTQSTSKTSLFWRLPDGRPDEGEDATITISTGLAERALYPVQTGGEIGPAYGSIEPPM